MDAALVAKAADERLDERRAEGRRKLEALDRDGLTQPDVRPLVDDAEAALADEAVHPVLSVEHLPDQTERIRARVHGTHDTRDP